MRRIYLPLITILLLACFTRPLQAYNAQDASQALVNAQVASQNAFTTLRNAQLAGANTTSLASQFNQALTQLEAAESADNTGDYNTAVNQANAATTLFNTIQTQATNLKTQTDTQNNIRAAILIISSIIAVALVTFGFHFIEGWRYRRWLKRLPEMRIIMKEEKREDT